MGSLADQHQQMLYASSKHQTVKLARKAPSLLRYQGMPKSNFTLSVFSDQRPGLHSRPMDQFDSRRPTWDVNLLRQPSIPSTSTNDFMKASCECLSISSLSRNRTGVFVRPDLPVHKKRAHKNTALMHAILSRTLAPIRMELLFYTQRSRPLSLPPSTANNRRCFPAQPPAEARSCNHQ
jgi:hypothetical protein